MGNLFRLVGGLAAAAVVVTGAAYLLQKRGLLNIGVNYTGKDGKPVTRDYDEIIDTAVGTAGKKVGDTANTVASEARETVSDTLEHVSDSLGDLADTVKPDEKKTGK